MCQSCPSGLQTRRFGKPNPSPAKTRDVSKEDRKLKLLAFLVDTGLALPRAAIHRNLGHTNTATWSRSSTKNYLNELVDEGDVIKVDPEAYEVGRVNEATERPVYFMATDQGVERVEDERRKRDTDIY